VEAETAVHQSREHADLWLAENFAGELGGAGISREPSKRATVNTAGAIRRDRGHGREAVFTRRGRAPHIQQAASARWRNAFTSTPGVTANSTWRNCTRSPTA
jgi:hypothetical protein